jgi:hypothetical protein
MVATKRLPRDNLRRKVSFRGYLDCRMMELARVKIRIGGKR